MPAVDIRPYTDRDGPSLSRIVGSLWADDVDMHDHAWFGPNRDEHSFARTLVAEEDGQPVGFASVWQSEIHYHPRDFRLAVAVERDSQGQSIGTALYDALCEGLCSWAPLRLRCLTAEDDLGARRFLEKRGWYVLLKSYQPVLPVGPIDLPALTWWTRELERVGYRFRTLADLAGAPQRDERITALCLEAYCEAHPQSPPTAPADVWKEIFLGRGCIEDAFFVAEINGRYAAFTSLRGGSAPGVMEAMWDGVAQADRPLAVPLRLALKAQEIAYARRHGIRELHWEVDSTDSAGMRLLDLLPFEHGPASLIWSCELAPVQQSSGGWTCAPGTW